MSEPALVRAYIAENPSAWMRRCRLPHPQIRFKCRRRKVKEVVEVRDEFDRSLTYFDKVTNYYLTWSCQIREDYKLGKWKEVREETVEAYRLADDYLREDGQVRETILQQVGIINKQLAEYTVNENDLKGISQIPFKHVDHLPILFIHFDGVIWKVLDVTPAGYRIQTPSYGTIILDIAHVWSKVVVANMIAFVPRESVTALVVDC